MHGPHQPAPPAARHQPRCGPALEHRLRAGTDARFRPLPVGL